MDYTRPPLREFLEIPYDKLEEMNLEAKQQRIDRVNSDTLRKERIAYLESEKQIKAVTVCFSDLEGRLHMLDYDKKFLLNSYDNLTFDGSSIHGFSVQSESDLRLGIDWPAFYWLPTDVFGPGKVLVFGEVFGRDGTPYAGDMRGRLKSFLAAQHKTNGYTCYAANEIEGFLFKGRDVERQFHETGHFDYVSIGGYYHSLPSDPLRLFIDSAAEAQRAMGFANEKDHPEVAPSQFEMNFAYSEALIAADQFQLYKLLCRQIAAKMGLTASFLPKPVMGVNGSGAHTNISIGKKKNLFYEKGGQDGVSKMAWEFVDRVLTSASDICLVLNSSVNSYRRLDPHFEAPNQIKVSAIDRGAMVRIPLGNEKSARVEVRSVAPDANIYMTLYTLLRTGLEGPTSEPVEEGKRTRTRFLPDNIHDAIRLFKSSAWTTELYGAEVAAKFAELKAASADRCPKALGTLVKPSEVQFHHEVSNQFLWNHF